jgi:hypothetical protein
MCLASAILCSYFVRLFSSLEVIIKKIEKAFHRFNPENVKTVHCHCAAGFPLIIAI